VRSFLTANAVASGILAAVLIVIFPPLKYPDPGQSPYPSFLIFAFPLFWILGVVLSFFPVFIFLSLPWWKKWVRTSTFMVFGIAIGLTIFVAYLIFNKVSIGSRDIGVLAIVTIAIVSATLTFWRMFHNIWRSVLAGSQPK
jgi:hypothetical protein